MPTQESNLEPLAPKAKSVATRLGVFKLFLLLAHYFAMGILRHIRIYIIIYNYTYAGRVG